MKLGTMMENARILANDFTQPPGFSDSALRVWLNEGVVEAARRDFILRDSTTEEICRIAVTAGVAEYAYDKRVLRCTRMAIAEKQNKILRQVKVELMDAFRPGWEEDTGEPECVVVGMNGRKFTLYPTPDEDMTLKLTVIRLPLVDMEEPDDEPDPSFPEEYCHALVQFALYRGFSMVDMELFDAEKSRIALKRFEEEFNTKEEANAMIEQMNFDQQTYHFNTGYN